jgi:hypothetical protein
MKILTFKGEVCFDCGAPPNVKTYKVDISGNEELYLCTKCFEIRGVYFSKTGNPLAPKVTCDGCNTNSHNEHHCCINDAVVDGVKTRKKCSCEECSDDSSEIQEFIGRKF